MNRRRTVERLGRAHRAVAGARRDATRKATRALVDACQGFAVEDLSLRGMTGTRMAGSLADAGLDGLLRVLRFKVLWAGRTWHVPLRFERSTGVHPDCALLRPDKRGRGRGCSCPSGPGPALAAAQCITATWRLLG